MKLPLRAAIVLHIVLFFYAIGINDAHGDHQWEYEHDRECTQQEFEEFLNKSGEKDGENSGREDDDDVDKGKLLGVEVTDEDFEKSQDTNKDGKPILERTGRKRNSSTVRKASINQFPFFASLIVTQNDGSTIRCAGALISDAWVLTAASCVASAADIKVNGAWTTHDHRSERAYLNVYSGWSLSSVPTMPLPTTRVAKSITENQSRLVESEEERVLFLNENEGILYFNTLLPRTTIITTSYTSTITETATKSITKIVTNLETETRSQTHTETNTRFSYVTNTRFISRTITETDHPIVWRTKTNTKWETEIETRTKYEPRTSTILNLLTRRETRTTAAGTITQTKTKKVPLTKTRTETAEKTETKTKTCFNTKTRVVPTTATRTKTQRITHEVTKTKIVAVPTIVTNTITRTRTVYPDSHEHDYDHIHDHQHEAITVTKTIKVPYASATVTHYPSSRSTPSSSEKAFIHPEYRKNSMSNNIALVQLQTPITFSGALFPVRIDKKGTRRNMNRISLTSMGFGENDSDQIYFTNLGQINKNDCRSRLAAIHEEYPDNTACLMSSNSSDGEFCHGGVGGPVVHTFQDEPTPTLLGIISQHEPCSSAYPLAYTQIGPYIDWIKSYVKQLRF